LDLVDESGIHIRCKKCGITWSPNTLPGGRMPRGYWKCPNQCNC